MSVDINSRLGELDAGTWVELFELDLSKWDVDSLYFHNGVNELMEPVVWQGVTYQPFPIEANGFLEDASGQNQQNPTLKVSNTSGVMSAYLKQYNDFIGAYLYRRRTMIDYLDAVNFIGGNDNADPDTHLPDQLWIVQQKQTEDKKEIVLQLSSPLDLDGVQIPVLQITANSCPWQYRGEVCGYDAEPVADAYDNPTSDPTKDYCSKSQNGCILRYGQAGLLPFGGQPASQTAGSLS